MNRLLGSGWQEAGWAPALGSGDVRTNVEASTAAASMRKMGDVICSFTDESTVASLLSAVVAQPETVGEQHRPGSPAAGMVTGSLPLGLTSPNSTLTSARSDTGLKP